MNQTWCVLGNFFYQLIQPFGYHSYNILDIIVEGKIMNVGVYFGGSDGYEKISVFFASLSTSSKEKLDLYLEFHFVGKTKFVAHCV